MSELSKLSVGIVGTGSMGGAIVTRLARSHKFKSIFCCDIDREKLKAFEKRSGVRTASSLSELCRQNDIIIIAVKPGDVPAVLAELKKDSAGRILVSIAAGVTIGTLEEMLPGGQKVVRVMPNAPALIGMGMTVLSAGTNTDEATLGTIEEIFSLIGRVLVLPERLMDAVTGLSGSGPAFVFTMIQAMTDGGVKLGLPREEALILASQTTLGAAGMILDGGDPMALRGRVASPGGTTIEGIHIMERAGFSGIVMDAIEAATLKSKKLGEKKQ